MKNVYVIARNPWSALYYLKKLREGNLEVKKIIFDTPEQAQIKFANMRSIDHAKFQIYGLKTSARTEEEVKVI